MTDLCMSECPHRSILESLGSCDRDDAELQLLELHIEKCERCQEILQRVASSNQLDLTGTIDAATHLPDAAPDLPGFRIERELGRGGGSVVYLAEDLSTSRLVAVKLIPGGWIRGPSSRLRWLEEVRVAARMQHHNLVRLYRVQETLHWFLLVFEYISGGTLRDRMRHPVAPRELAGLMQTIACAVEQVHLQGVLHLDLKPSNILIDDADGSNWTELVPKVSDFGIARWNHGTEEEQSGGLHRVGTPACMSPEQVVGDAARFSPATDVYGLGGILYAMLTGMPPVQGSSASAILGKVMATKVEFPKDCRSAVPPGLADICLKCLEKHPQDRIATPRHLADALQQWMDAETSSGHTWLRRLSLPLSAAFALAVLLFVLLQVAQPRTSSPISQSQVTASLIAENDSMSRSTAADVPAAQLEDLSFADLINEVSEDPAAFDAARLERLIAASLRHTEQTLLDSSQPVDQWLRLAVLQQRAAERFASSIQADLYPAATCLLQNSVLLLERSLQLRPENPAVLLELVATRFLQSQLRIQLDEMSLASASRHVVQCASCLLPTTADAMGIRDQRHRIYWLGKILDQYRSIGSMAEWQGDRPTALQVKSYESQSWLMMEREQSIPDLFFRHALMQTIGTHKDFAGVASATDGESRTDDANTDLTFDGMFSVPDTLWVIEDHRKWLETETIYHLLANVLFEECSDPNIDPETSDASSDSKWKDVIDRALRFMDQQQIDRSALTGIIHYDLIRPLAAIATFYRVQGRIDQAESLQAAYMKLCQTGEKYFPDNADLHLAVSEAYLQRWKNEIRRDHTDEAINALKDSHREAAIALDLSPDSTRARFQVADRIKRLTRIQLQTRESQQ